MAPLHRLKKFFTPREALKHPDQGKGRDWCLVIFSKTNNPRFVRHFRQSSTNISRKIANLGDCIAIVRLTRHDKIKTGLIAEIGKEIIAGGLIPIIEPEVNIKSEQKAQAEEILKTSLVNHLNKLNENKTVMLKLSLPTKPNLYQDLVDHPRVLKVVALSGGYSRDDANKMLAENKGVIASFSRALTEGLSAKQSDDQFDALLDSTIQSIFDASVNKK